MENFDAKDILADLFEIDISSISLNAKIGELQGWDSLGHMRLVIQIENIMNRSITTEEIVQIVDVKSINSVLNRRSDEANE